MTDQEAKDRASHWIRMLKIGMAKRNWLEGNEVDGGVYDRVNLIVRLYLRSPQ